MRVGFKVMVSGAALVAMTLAGASTATAQEPAAPEKPVFPLPQSCQDCDLALVTILIKPDKTADFEMVLNKAKESLAKSEKPGRKEQAAGWIVFKSSSPGPKTKEGVDSVVYVMRIDPIVKGAEYDFIRIINEVFPVEVQEIFPKYRDAFAGRIVTEMKRFMTMQ